MPPFFWFLVFKVSFPGFCNFVYRFIFLLYLIFKCIIGWNISIHMITMFVFLVRLKHDVVLSLRLGDPNLSRIFSEFYASYSKRQVLICTYMISQYGQAIISCTITSKSPHCPVLHRIVFLFSVSLLDTFIIR